MAKFDLLIRGGEVLLPGYSAPERVNIAVSGGKIAALTEAEPAAAEIIDAGGLCVAPGFIDIHMHDEEAGDGNTVELALLRQGVTTAIAGNCGSGPLAADIKPFRKTPWLNLGYLTGHTKLREKAGVTNIYAASPPKAVAAMSDILNHELEKEGSFGVSFGLEYLPNTSREEIEALLKTACCFKNVWVPVHIRADGPAAVNSVDEIIGYAQRYPLRFQISHTGSMCAFGCLSEVLDHISAAIANGSDITFDCYPYDAFCTSLGSAVFDKGFEERWGRGCEYLEIGSGPHRGKFLSEEGLYEKLRREAPETLIIAHVMNGVEVEKCLMHPRCAVASDSLLLNGHGHPRVAGTFPRAINIMMKNGLSLAEAVRKCTALPAAMAFLDGDKGAIKLGSDADFVIFDMERLRDRATFAEELLPPEGIEWVVIGGMTAVHKNEIVGGPWGKLITRA
ncbi:MAG: amidohydrolase family protein [bacterium]|nr:amidohydrolase family protein [bacterium]